MRYPRNRVNSRACDFEVGGGRVEPGAAVRGDLARIYLAMDAGSGIGLTSEERQQFEAWSAADPPDGWEIERDERIREVEGAGNPLLNR